MRKKSNVLTLEYHRPIKEPKKGGGKKGIIVSRVVMEGEDGDKVCFLAELKKNNN